MDCPSNNRARASSVTAHRSANRVQASVSALYVGITLERRGLDIDDVDDAIGRLFVITLSFQDVDMIDASCTLNTWDDTYQTIEGS